MDVDLLKADLEIDLSLPDSEFESLGGFITTFLGDLPSQGDVITYESIEMTILEADDRRIKRVKIIRRPTDDEKEADTTDKAE